MTLLITINTFKNKDYFLKPFAAVALCAGLQIACAAEICPLPTSRIIENPPIIASVGGVLNTHLFAYNTGAGPLAEQGNPPHYDYRFCLLTEPNQQQTPILRANPGDTITLRLSNKMTAQPGFPAPHLHGVAVCAGLNPLPQADITALNLHFHGLNTSPVCGSDNVLNTVLHPKLNPQFTYSFTIPANDPPGMSWFHPHIHGIAQQHFLGGMSGVLLVDGMEKFFPEVSQLPEKVLILRDLDKKNPADNSEASSAEPWKDVSINSIPIRYGSKQPLPMLQIIAGGREFWRVANASADTHFVLQVQFHNAAASAWENQNLELLAFDGVPLTDNDGLPLSQKRLVEQIVLPPGSRAEFIVSAPPPGVAARFYSADFNAYLDTLSVDCAVDFPNSVCDNTDRTPARTLATITTSSAAVKSALLKPPFSQVYGKLQRFTHLNTAPVAKERRLYFSKSVSDDGDFFITVDDSLNPVKPKAFAISDAPLVVKAGTVEDWIIENRDNEAHVFHIHQIHFQVLAENGKAVDFYSLRDTIELGACQKWAAGVDPEKKSLCP